MKITKYPLREKLFGGTVIPQVGLGLLVLKPLIDLAWRWKPVEVLGQGLNLQTAAALLAIPLGLVQASKRPARLIPDLPVVLFGAWAAVAWVVSPSVEGFSELLRLFSGLAFFFIGGSVLCKEETFKQFGMLFLVSVGVPIALSYLQALKVLPYEYWDTINGGLFGRVSGTYPHPLGIVYYFIFATPIALLMMSSSRRWQERLLVWLFIAGLFGSLVLTLHRVGQISVGAGLLGWLVLNRKRQLAVLLLLVAAVMGIFFRDWLAQYFANLMEFLKGDVALFSDRFLRGRGSAWYLFLESFRTGAPQYWILGHGAAVASGIVPGVGYIVSNEPHNDYIRVLYDYGIIGLTLYLILLVKTLRSGLALRGSVSTFDGKLGTLGVIATFSVALLAITTEPLRYPTASWYFFAISAAVLARARTRDRLNRREVLGGGST